MSYTLLVQRAVPTLGPAFSLAELLARVDALGKTVPTLAELNATFAEIERCGQFPSHNWGQVTEAAYNQALSQNWEQLAQSLEAQGISRERQQEVLAEHRRRWQKHDA